jgi:hypothetical protein
MTPLRYVQKNHPIELILGDNNLGIQMRRKLVRSPKHENLSLLSKIEPKNLEEAIRDKIRVNSMKNETWELVPRTTNKNVIGTKWVFQNKLNEDGQVVRNKVRMVCKVYCQVEGLYFDENFSPVARLEKIRIFLAFASYNSIKFYQMAC